MPARGVGQPFALPGGRCALNKQGDAFCVEAGTRTAGQASVRRAGRAGSASASADVEAWCRAAGVPPTKAAAVATTFQELHQQLLDSCNPEDWALLMEGAAQVLGPAGTAAVLAAAEAPPAAPALASAVSTLPAAIAPAPVAAPVLAASVSAPVAPLSDEALLDDAFDDDMFG